MEGTKLEMSGKPTTNDPPATYKPIPETDMEEETVAARPKSLVKSSRPSSREVDGADERMLPKDHARITSNSNIDLSDVKISPNEKQNGDAKLDIGDVKSVFVGMGKEELMKFANDPFWVRLRWFLFITFWLLWASMLVGAILIIYAAPKCDPPPPRTWWQEGPLTEVQSDTKLDDLKALKQKGVQAFIMNWPEDTYAKFDDTHEVAQLLQQAKKDDVKVIIDLEPSSSFVWFNKSEENDDSVSDYYIWQPPKNSGNTDNEPPNNWLTVNNQPSWTFSNKRKEYYYSPHGKPHLNFRNDNVTGEFSNVIKRFIEKGAAGVRIKNAAFLLVDAKFENEILKPLKASGSILNEYAFYIHSKTENLLELGPLLSQWRNVVKNGTENGPFIVAEQLSNLESYKVNNTLMVDLPLQSHVFSKPTVVVADVVNSLNYTFNIDGVSWPLWKANTSAIPKDALDIVTYLLPGAPLVDAGDVISSQLLKIRKSPSIMRGSCSIHSIHNDTVFAFIRVTSGIPGILVALNSLDEKVTVNFAKEIPPLSELQEVTVQMYSNNYNETDFMDINAKKDATAIPISPSSVIVLSYVPKKKSN